MNLQIPFTDVWEDLGLVGDFLLVLGAILLGYVVHRLVFGVLQRWGKYSELPIVQLLNQYLRGPMQLVFILLALHFITPFLAFAINPAVRHFFTLILIGAGAFLAIRAVGLVIDLLNRGYDGKLDADFHARKVYTQFKVIERVMVFLIVIFAIAIALMTFEQIRQIGVSLLASAGIAGIILGFAAQKSLSTLFAGIQIAIAQPIRIDDAVIVEGEWGRIEEITLTFVVVKIWDERRLVVPINYFLDKPFQSWTRKSSELIGAVFVYTDFSAPVAEMRQELTRILNSTPLWDRRASGLMVTNASEKTMEIRIIASAANAGQAFELRCFIREKMITFLQQNYPESLPRTRVDLDRLAGIKPGTVFSDFGLNLEKGSAR
jgi:small-conductance mechanosensitive channel